ncbi:MAG: phage tail terminator protein [Exilibacterium sp.]
MSARRPAIRQAVKALIEAHYPGPVEDSRHINAEGKNAFVAVYLPSGELEAEGLTEVYDAQLEIAIYHRQRVSDSALDAVGHTIETAIDSDPSLSGLVRGLTLRGFDYPEDTDPFTVLVLRYSVQYDR